LCISKQFYLRRKVWKKTKEKSLLAGGESENPNSKHFNGQGLIYCKGEFKDVLFYKEDILKHVERKYHPGGEF
jgi:acyl-homoserine-lactone acylase